MAARPFGISNVSLLRSSERLWFVSSHFCSRNICPLLSSQTYIPLTSLSQGDWYCPQCVGAGRAGVYRRISKRNMIKQDTPTLHEEPIDRKSTRLNSSH